MVFRNLNKETNNCSTSELLIDDSGFTLLEMLVAMALSLLVLSGVYEVFTSQQKAYTVQDQVAEMQQNARVAMDIITRNLRNAAYDPRSTDKFGITDSAYSDSSSSALVIANSDQIYFTLDDDEDKSIDSNADERIGFQLNGTDIQIDSDGALGWQDIAENITSLSFTYTFDDGGTGLPDNTDSDSTNNTNDVRIIQVSLTARTAREDSGYDGGYDIDSDASTGTARTRTLTANVRPRNLGL